jgi:hypothetical protein
MQNNLLEDVAVDKTIGDAELNALRTLNELQLASVGGGIAELVGV